MSAKKKKAPVKRKAPARKKPPALTVAEVRRMQKASESAIAALCGTVRELEHRVQDLGAYIDRSVAPMIHRLALLGDWSLIKPEDGQRLMSVAGGEMEPVYIEWRIFTFGVEATRERYKDRLSYLPPYLRQKL